MALEVRDLHAGYQRDIEILRGVSVTARDGQLTTVIGANGAGKSTLLKTIVGQLRPTSGSILYDGTDLTGVPGRDLVRRRIAYIAQHHALFRDMTVAENLELGTWSFRSDRARARRALMSDPKLLLIDEPTVGLDPKRAGAIYERLRRLVGEEGRTILMVDQNIIAGVEVADYIYVLELGGNKIEGSKATFDSEYRDSIADWLL